MHVEVAFDRVGAQYTVGETVTGAVKLRSETSTTHSGVSVFIEGTLAVYSSVRGLASFEPHYAKIRPVTMLSATIQLSPKGEKLPAGEVEMPFAFDLVQQHPKVPLLETYQGVYISSLYRAVATVQHFVGKTTSEPIPFLVVAPGQAIPSPEQIAGDSGIAIKFSQDAVRAGKRYNGDRIPRFLVEGKIDKFYNDIDIPLSGWIAVRYCEARITSLELQLIRVESGASADGIAREATEIQNIQIGDGDVMRMLEIPIYMFFPRWYTSPSIKSTSMKVEFEINVVITLEEQNQITQNIPIKLYRSLSP
jgi:hypothetical protein